MAPQSKDPFYYIDSSGQPVLGAIITVRIVGGSVDLFTYDEPDPDGFPGLYVLVARSGEYDRYIGGVYQPALSPYLHLDVNG